MANYCFTVPILPGGIELARKWNQENIVDNKEHDEVFKEAGISREQVWIQHLPQGDFAVASYETDNPEKSFKVLATSNKPWAVKFREYAKKAYGIDFGGPPPSLNEMIIDWHQEEE